jgi:hypothetical protein
LFAACSTPAKSPWKPPGHDQHRGAEFVERHQHLFRCLRLRHNAHLVFYRQNFGDARAENCLVISQNQFQHLFCTSRLTLPHKIVRINHTRYSVLVAAASIFADNAPLALNHHMLISPRQFRRQSNFKFNVGADIQRGIAANVHTGSAHVSGNAALVHALNLDRQFQRKSFSCSRFGHKPSLPLVQASNTSLSARPAVSIPLPVRH